MTCFLVRSLINPCSTLFPYTTLFRSAVESAHTWQTSRQPAIEHEGCLEGASSGPASGLGPSFNFTLGPLWSPKIAHSTGVSRDRKSTRLNSSHVAISYAVFCLKKKNT